MGSSIHVCNALMYPITLSYSGWGLPFMCAVVVGVKVFPVSEKAKHEAEGVGEGYGPLGFLVL
jgi:hypothetical protein